MISEGTPRPFAVAFEARVVRRALVFAVVVGSVLIAINHGDALISGDIDGVRWLKMGLTVLVPYLVSTWSSVLAVRGAR
ncbi:MAG: nitrate/nitrite transporter NrtS [Deltaproteobacteria bacterium]|nr:nitrate/nitrite transporter NrtS [Deltaproteobacteria bacterium]